MENQLIPKSTLIPNNLTDTINSLSTSLKSIAPANSETTKIITYTLIGAAITGICVYHYIKNQELE